MVSIWHENGVFEGAFLDMRIEEMGTGFHKSQTSG